MYGTAAITVTAPTPPPIGGGGSGGGGGGSPTPTPTPRPTPVSTPHPEPEADDPSPREEPEGFDIENINTYRLVAVCPDGVILGGRFNRATNEFIFETRDDFTIEYIQTLNRLRLQIGLFTIIDVAENAPVQIMDVTPVIVDGRTLLPVRFVAYSISTKYCRNSRNA